ncbi:MAG: phosphodiester glycosidase family protein [Phascolarctobacterium sp.]|nr:phosphodiester glycosidase family protein [Phascolarctobacterium sp.]
MFSKKILVMLLTLVLIIFSTTTYAAPITNMRNSVSPARVRFVLDSSEPVAYKVEQTSKKLIITMPKSAAQQKNVLVKDNIVRSAQLVPTGRNSSQLTINMIKNCQYKVLQYTNPNRLVIDVFRIDLIKQEKTLAKGITYTYIQDEMNGTQIQANVLSVAPKAKYELRPFSAAGAYNGRGLLSKEAKRRKLKAAANASYFDIDGWVIAVNKDKGNFLSMDSTPRSAYVDTGKKRLIVKDVAYKGVLRFKGGELNIKGMNRARISEDVVLFNEYYGTSTKTNQWGREIKLRGNKVIEVSNKGNMKIEPGMVVISAHGLANKYLLRSIAVGDEVELVQELNVPEADKAPMVMGGGPLILENGKVNVRSREENIPRDIAVGSAPRTAIGLKKDGTVLVLVVDGRSNTSRGLTLQELATYFLRLGACDAMNLDGGGSSVMVINGEIVNKPSDGRERPVSMAMGLFPKY